MFDPLPKDQCGGPLLPGNFTSHFTSAHNSMQTAYHFTVKYLSLMTDLTVYCKLLNISLQKISKYRYTLSNARTHNR